MMIQMVIVLSVLGSYMIVMSDEVNLTATIPPGYALQDYLCSGPLKSNTTVVLDDGEYRMSSGPPCDISNGGNIAIIGSSMKNTTVRCEGEGRVLRFISVQNLTLERMTFISCGIQLVSIENTVIANCTFQSSSMGQGAISSQSSTNIDITSCVFQNSATDGGGAVMLDESKGNVNITNCIFQNNSAGYGGGAVWLFESTGDVSITNCTFQNNSATYGGAVALYYGTNGDVSITNCTFQNNSATNGGGVMMYGSTGEVSIINCTFQNNSAIHTNAGYGGAVLLDGSTGNVSITNCTFQNNSAYGGGGAVRLYEPKGDISITECTFQDNSATSYGGGVRLDGSNGSISITNCTFQDNSANNGVGGAVMLYESTGDISITECTFQDNSANVGGAVRLYESTGDISITECTFQDNSANVGGAVWLLYGSTGDISITECTFQDNSAYSGGAMMLYAPIGDVSIINCSFQNNSATLYGGGGAMYLHGPTADVSIMNCSFQNNSAYDGDGGAVFLDGATSNVSVTYCTFQNNSALYGGGVWLGGSTGNVSITNCTFHNNSATYGGGVWLGGSTGNVDITNCTFHNNRAILGGAMWLDGSMGNGGAISILSAHAIIIYNSAFTNNTAVTGAAVHAQNSINSQGEPLGHLLLQDVAIKDNHCSRGGAIYFDGMKVDIFGNTPTGSQFSSNSAQGAIRGQNGLLLLHGNITFTENRGVNGGAVSLSNNVPLQFCVGCRVEFSRNVATGSGGAIYNDGEKNQALRGSTCIILFIHIYPVPLPQPQMFSITFTDNHAQQSGHAVYATPIYNCNNKCFQFQNGINECTNELNLTSYFTITSLPGDSSDLQVLTFPTDVHLCGCSDPKLCNVISQNLGKATTYPGGTVRLNVTSVGDGNNLSPSVVYTQIDTSGINITFGPRQEAQWIRTVCGTIEYQIYGAEMALAKLLLTNNPNNPPTVIEVELLPCEPGFTLMSDSSTGQKMCDCSLFFTSLGVVCDTADGTVTRNKNNWIGMYNNTLPALASTCPLDYCNNTINKLSLSRSGDLCNGGRTGILCGHCHGNQSVIFGSSKCQMCTDMWLITLVMFAVLGVLLVAALFFLNLTVTQGTLYGLIFYANIIQVNASILFNQSILNPMKVIVSFVNLDLGLPLCFYDGMDDADKAGLQFVFPAYLLILTMTVIVLCHYCLQRSPTSSTSSCWYRFPIIIGERAVGVLSTLIYLSYSKLLRTVIDVLTYSTVHLPTGDMYVWFYDGNVEYFHGKHTVLSVVAMVTCTLFLLPYTFALTFIPIIERYSEHNRLFNYLHKKANQMKPMNDAHYAPYKGEWRWWLGARLWLLVVMYSLNPVLSSDKPSLLLSIQATVVILFAIAQAGIKPFGQSHQQTDRCTRYTILCNQLCNCLDLFYLLNYIALALSMSYILDQSSNQAQMTLVSVGVLVGLYVVVLMVTVLYHLIVVNGLFERKYELMVPIEMDDPTTNTVSTTTVTVSCDLREPLCED